MNVKEPRPADAKKIRRPGRKAVAVPSSRPGKRQVPPDVAEWIEKARRLPAVRKDLVERVKAEIDDGAYETPEKLQIAIERLLEEFC